MTAIGFFVVKADASIAISADVQRKLLRCPNLVKLSLGRTMEAVDETLIAAYASVQCKIASLTLDDLGSDNSDVHKNLVRALIDPAFAPARKLQVLYLSDTGRHSSG